MNDMPRWKAKRVERVRRHEEDNVKKEDEWDQCDAAIPVEQNMWIAVILQAFADAAWVKPNYAWKYTGSKQGKQYRILVGRNGRPRKVYESQDNNSRGVNENNKAHFEAIAWLFSGSKDFYDVCFLAGAAPEKVRDAARAAEAKGWPPIAAW